MPDNSKPLLLRNVPPNVKKLILLEQGEMKAKCNCQISITTTICSIVRKWQKAKKIAINGVLVEKMVEELS